MTFTRHSADAHVDRTNPEEVFEYCCETLHILLFAPTTRTPDGTQIQPMLDIHRHSSTYNAVFDLCNHATSHGYLRKKGDLYTMLAEFMDQISDDIAEDIFMADRESNPPSGDEMIARYLAAWDRFKNVAVVAGNCFAYLDRSYVLLEELDAKDRNSGYYKVDAGDLSWWRYPSRVTSKIVAETSARAASNAVAINVRALILRNWRLKVAEKMNIVELRASLKAIKAQDQSKGRALANAIRTSYLWVGVEPTTNQVKMLDEIAGDSGVRETYPRPFRVAQ